MLLLSYNIVAGSREPAHSVLGSGKGDQLIGTQLSIFFVLLFVGIACPLTTFTPLNDML
jgi:hypothetical protein